jgi:hypothetical protein
MGTGHWWNVELMEEIKTSWEKNLDQYHTVHGGPHIKSLTTELHVPQGQA